MSFFKKRKSYTFCWLERQKYIMDVYNEQSKAPITNPSIREVKNAIKQYDPKDVLEIGCGWGRLAKPLSKYFNIVGCDIQPFYLEKAKERGLKVFYLDITKETVTAGKYDILFCYGLLMYFNKKEIKRAIENMLEITNKKIIIYEWADTCEKILSVVNKELILDSDKLELHLILNEGHENWKKGRKNGN